MTASSHKTTRGRAPVALPPAPAPMMAVLTQHLPAAGEHPWSFEYKWDGVRAILRFDGSELSLHSRNLLDVTSHYPELHALAEALGRHKVLLDGEIIALDEQDRPSFPELQRRMHVHSPSQRLIADVPVHYMIFDLLYLDRRSTMPLPLEERRQLLEELTLAGPSWRLSPAHEGHGEAMLQTARQTGLEGVVAKRLDSPYEPGRRSPNWLKIKVVQRQEFVIGGWTNMENTRDTLGALLVGYYDAASGKLRYAGSVGTGFDARIREQLQKQLARLAARSSPFAERVPRPNVRWVKPTLVAEVEYRRWPAGGSIQQAAYKGLREDRPARNVIRECPTEV